MRLAGGGVDIYPSDSRVSGSSLVSSRVSTKAHQGEDHFGATFSPGKAQGNVGMDDDLVPPSLETILVILLELRDFKEQWAMFVPGWMNWFDGDEISEARSNRKR